RAAPPPARAHPPDDVEFAALLDGAAAALHRDRTGSAYRGDVERKRLRRADVRLPESAEQDAQHRTRIGRRADGRARVGTHSLLIHDDRCGEALQDVDLRSRLIRHEALDEGAVGLVDQPLRFRGDRVEHQRALAGARDPGEYREPALRKLDVDVLEIVLACSVYTDQIVAVGD